MLRPPAPVIRSSPFDVGALLNACIIIIINDMQIHGPVLLFREDNPHNLWSFHPPKLDILRHCKMRSQNNYQNTLKI